MTRPHVKSALDPDRHDGRAALAGDEFDTPLDLAEFAIEAACPFRKEHDAPALLERGRHILVDVAKGLDLTQALLDGFRAAAGLTHHAIGDEQLEIVAGNRTALAFYTWSPYMHNPKLPHRLHRVKMPTRLIWGESDGLVTPAYGAALQAMIPGAEMVTIPNAGHLPQIEQPDAFIEAVLEFAS